MVLDLERKLTRSTFTGYSTGVVSLDENGHVTGGPRLRQTQEYPEGFAKALFASWATADYTLMDDNLQDFSGSPAGGVSSDLWLDAGTAAIATDLGVPLDRLLF